MKKLMDVFILLCLFSLPVFGQNMNPQTNFVAQEQLANPSLLLNFNDATASFADSISGLSFTQPLSGGTQVGSFPTPVGSNPSGSIQFSSAPSISGQLSSVTIQYAVAPASGQTCTILIGTISGSNVTIVDSFVVTVASTTAVQTFVSGTNYTARSVTSGEVIGYWAGSGSEPGYTGSGTYRHYYASSSTSPSGTYAFTSYANPPAIYATVTPSAPGTIVPQQTGFDNTNPANYSAAFPYNSYAAAPNNTLGAIDWNTPWTMLVHIDRLNWNRTGTLVLASKGDISSGNWWKLYVTISGLYSQVCFVANGYAAGSTSDGGICTRGATGTTDVVPNGFNYDIIVTNAATGAPGTTTGPTTPNTFSIYVNGLNGTYIQETNTAPYGVGFGNVNLALSGGTGYAATTPFTSTGGGPNCRVAGTMNSSSGIPSSFAFGSSQPNFGCISAPTIVLTSPTGTGVTITATPTGASMNSTTLPLMVPGYVSSGAYNGIDGADSMQTSTNVDEFAIFPGVMSATNIQSLYYLTKFYQGVLGTPQHVPMLLAESSCGDYGSTTTVSVAAALHRLGYINLLGLDVEYDNGFGAATWRQVLDQSGLNNIPIGMPSNASTISPGGGWCLSANITAYNASTPQLYTGYESSSKLFRTIFAANPTTAIVLNNPTQVYGIYDFMNSAADSISPKTGAQLWLQNVTNGGSMYLEGGPTCVGSTLPATTPCANSTTGDNLLVQPTQSQYVLNNLQGMPLYLMGGSPAPNGPGVLVTRTSKDPLYLASAYIGTDSRTAWDSLGTMMMLSGLFQGGVQIGYSGGSGYANATAFTSTGGGPNCSVTGYMSASGGVPNGIKTPWGGYSTLSSWSTYGHGCTSAPTIVLTAPTGTGVTLTAYPSTVCGTDAITQPSGVWTDSFTSATCSNEYSVIPSWYAWAAGAGGGAPIYQWLLNSLENPVPVGQPRAQ